MPSRPIRFGIQTPQEGATYDALVAHWREADALGFDSVWLDDHLYAVVRPAGEPQMEAWTLLAALARDTKTIRLGCLVTAAQYRNPALLAKTVAGVDQMSDGRVEFGIGAGWKVNEYKAYGYDFAEPGARVDQMIDALEICRRLWTEERATYHCKHYRIDDAVCAPKPKQRPYTPIWIGGSKPRVMRVAARLADGFDISRSSATQGPMKGDDIRAAKALLAEACRAANRDRPLRTSHWSDAVLEDTDASKRALRERVTDYSNAGLDRFILAFPKDRALEMVRRAGDVLSA